MKIDTTLIRYHKDRPYISYFVKTGKWNGKEVRMYGDFRICKKCGDKFFSTLNHINNGHGTFCSILCTRQYNSKENHCRWKGGVRLGDKGYVRVMNLGHPEADKHGYVYEHRLVAERIIGRLLYENEVVHHKNGHRDDNSIDNLVVMDIGQHKALHQREKYYGNQL